MILLVPDLDVVTMRTALLFTRVTAVAHKHDFLLVPAMAAAHEGRFADCAGLLEVLRSNLIALDGGTYFALARQLRDLAKAALEPAELAAAREAGQQIGTDTALADFLHPTQHA